MHSLNSLILPNWNALFLSMRFSKNIVAGAPTWRYPVVYLWNAIFLWIQASFSVIFADFGEWSPRSFQRY